ncbi:MAG: hypothetical protein IK080_11760, partial [Clostridia bacterium]|nr:hypothetical protein [Clostridia bacterium]
VVATMSGINNSLTYVGASSGVYLFGKIADNEALGWNAVLISWVAIAAGGMLVCFFAARPWKRFKAKMHRFLPGNGRGRRIGTKSAVELRCCL